MAVGSTQHTSHIKAYNSASEEMQNEIKSSTIVKQISKNISSTHKHLLFYYFPGSQISTHLLEASTEIKMRISNNSSLPQYTCN